MKKASKKKVITLDNLAGMVQRGFLSVDKKFLDVDKKFIETKKQIKDSE